MSSRVLPVLSDDDIVVLIDVHETRSGAEIIAQLPYEERRFPWCAVTADVADIIVCTRYTPEQLRTLQQLQRITDDDDNDDSSPEKKRKHQLISDSADGDIPATVKLVSESLDEEEEEEESASSSSSSSNILFNPVVDYCQATSPEVAARFGSTATLERDKYIYVPVLAIERKESKDMASSIAGSGKNPGFLRLKDQKLRQRQFSEMTGCDIGYVLEEYFKHCNQPRVGRVDLRRFDSALLDTAYIDRIPVHHTVDFLHTVHFVVEVARRALKYNLCNVLFPRIHAAVEAKIVAGELSAAAETSDQRRRFEHGCLLEASRIRSSHELLYRTVPTSRVGDDHSKIVAIRKKDAHNPQLRMQMQLSCIPGVSDKTAAIIQRRYPTLPSLINAYEAIDESDTKAREQLLVKLDKIGKVRSADIYRRVYSLDVDEAPQEDSSSSSSSSSAAAAK